MRIISRDIALLTLPTLIHAVSLADMVPRAEGLPSGCEKVYTAQIPGCTSDEFASKKCSQSCIHGLESLYSPIMQACGNRGVTGQNLIVAFLAGVGPGAICLDAPQSWTGEPSSGSWTSYMSSTSSSPTMKKTTVTSGVSTASSIASFDSSSLLVDTSRTPTTGALTQMTSTSGASPLPSQLNTNDHSGGGSPFDTAGNMSGAACLSFSAAITLLSAAVSIFTNFR